MKAIDIKELLEDLAEQTRIAAADRNIDVEFIDEAGDGSVMVRSDEDLLMRIILNLVENATKYGKTPDGHIELRLRKDPGKVVVTVADDGEGISEEDQSKVWNRFYQTEASRNRRDSSGLGLAMVDSLTNALGGSIRIVPDAEKRPGELPGAVFELTLPTH
jgi:signal transduction histidine kinase